METDEARRVLPFQLQFDKPVASQNGTLRRICWRWSPKIPRFCCTASIGRGSGQSLQDSVIPHSVVASLAVSSSRGVACVFAARKRVLVYILDEDEDEVSDAESVADSGNNVWGVNKDSARSAKFFFNKNGMHIVISSGLGKIA